MKTTAATETAGIRRNEDERTEYLVYAAVAEEVDVSLQEGREPDIDTLVAKHPKLATHIKELVPTLVTLHQLGHDAGVKAAGATDADRAHTPGRLGDYRIIREVGRGGMGVVYEASQISLNRRVALKVLPFAAVLDKRQLQRFKNEAQAAAQLHHTNIVPVFSVGNERGVHYYAMQYIEGRTLSDTIGELRQLSGLNGFEQTRPFDDASNATNILKSGRSLPTRRDVGVSQASEANPVVPDGSSAVVGFSSKGSTRSPEFFRSVARLGVQAAGALDHAHESGVLHRDIKPSNLLLDNTGKLWITDFGLAQVQSDPGITMTGDLLGTPRYMSPEQAMAKRVSVDHRTDIYSLGVTLYELATLQPAFTGRDRQEVLRQIAFDEPRAPRRLNKALPTELETIVLKSISKNPAERYDTAQDLADDLQRFLEDKPIRAKRPTILERAMKWSRRHRSVVVSAVVLLVLAVTSLALSTVLIAREQARTAAALAQAQANLETAEVQRERAKANFQKARDAVDRMLTQVADELPHLPGMPELMDLPQVEQIKQSLLEDALAFYEGFLEEQGSDPLIRFETAHAYLRVGEITQAMDQYDRAEETYRGGINLLEELSAEFPDNPDYRTDLGGAYCDLGDARTQDHRHKAAESAYHQALEVQEELAREDATATAYRSELSLTYRQLSLLLDESMRRLRDAEDASRRNFELLEELAAEVPSDPEYRDRLGWAYVHLANVLNRLDLAEEAEGLCRQAIALAEKLVVEQPGIPGGSHLLAFASRELGDSLTNAHSQEAEVAYRRSLALYEHLAEQFPDDPEAFEAGTHWPRNNLGRLLQTEFGRSEEAEELLREGLELAKRHVEEQPGEPELRNLLAWAYGHLAWLFKQTGRSHEAADLLRQAVGVREELVADFPGEPEYRTELAETYWDLGVTLKNEVGDKNAALVLYRRSFELREGLVAEFPDNPQHVDALAWSHSDLGLVLSNLGRYEEAIKELRVAMALGLELVTQFPNVPEYRASLAHRHHWLGSRLWNTNQSEEAEHHYRQSLEIRERLVAEFPNDTKHRQDLAHVQWYLADLLMVTGRHGEAEQQLDDALRLLHELVADFPDDHGFRHHLGDCYRVLGDELLVTNRRREAETALRQSLAVYEALMTDFPDMPWYGRHLLTFLANCPDSQFRDAPRAVEVGHKCIEQAPDNAEGWRFLGVAQYRAGQWEAALNSLERSMELDPDGYYAFEWFFLAMAHWRLGDQENQERARQFFDQAVPSMRQEIAERPAWNKRFRLELLHAEAAELLGIDEEPTPEDELTHIDGP